MEMKRYNLNIEILELEKIQQGRLAVLFLISI